MSRPIVWCIASFLLGVGCSGETQDELGYEQEQNPITNEGDDSVVSDASVPVAENPDKPGTDGSRGETTAEDAGTDAVVTVQHAVTVAVDGAGEGQVTGVVTGADGQVIACSESEGDCAETLAAGAQMQLTALPAGDSTFLWGGACAGETAATCTLAVTEARNVTVSFPLREFTLTVTVRGNGSVEPWGSGSVVSLPEGISCTTAGNDAITCTARFTAHTPVRLTATPTPGGGSDFYAFGGWGDACASALDNQTCELVIDGDTTVSAGFVYVIG